MQKKANGSHVTGTIRSLVEKNKELDALLRARSTAADAQSIDDANKALMDAWLKHLAEFGVDHADVVDRQKQIAKVCSASLFAASLAILTCMTASVGMS